MSAIVITSLLLALIIYIAVGLTQGRHTKGIADLLPLALKGQARVKSSSEFASSTVATTISLATVVMAFFELARNLGVWLFWTMLTTAAGLLVVRFFAKKILQRIAVYDHRPTLHEFLGKEFNSQTLSCVGAVCTSLGFLSAFAVELTVGSKFFAGLVPNTPPWIVLVLLSVVAFVYTGVGGFRAVIVTDRIQMVSIWLLLFSLPAFYLYYVFTHGGWTENFIKIPAATLTFSYREGLVPFLLGIFVINVPTYISDMSLWQRIGGAQKDQTVLAGLWKSVFSAAATWGILALLACFAFMIAEPQQGVNPLLSVLGTIGKTKGVLALGVLFVTVLGLYGAMLSTASTQLIAVSHTLYTDIFSRIRNHHLIEKVESKSELNLSRAILIITAILSIIFVGILSNAGFSIADLVFALYGAQVGLCPIVISALLLKRERLKNLSFWAAAAVSAGFVTGWGAAIYGRFTGNTNLVFLAPVCSLVISSVLLGIGLAANWLRKSEQK
ncbi:hypothetical protein ACFL1G_02000 [Planctomycetota bacterium]